MTRYYGIWAGNYSGTKEVETRCIVSVFPSDGRGWHSHQCLGKRGFGPDGLYCKRHAKMIEDGSDYSTGLERESNA